MAATNSQHGFDAVIKSTKMGPTDILQPKQRVESLKLIYSCYMLHISCIIRNKITCYPHQRYFWQYLVSKLGISTTFKNKDHDFTWSNKLRVIGRDSSVDLWSLSAHMVQPKSILAQRDAPIASLLFSGVPGSPWCFHPR